MSTEEEEVAVSAEEEVPATTEEEEEVAEKAEEEEKPTETEATTEEETKDEEEQPHIDITLLANIEAAMSEEEQILVTKLMTSGNPDDCRHAARILTFMTDMLKSGVHHHTKRSDKHSQALKRIHETEYSNRVAVHKSKLTGSEKVTRKIRKEQMQTKAWMAMHPLPARMPYYIEIAAYDPFAKGLLAKKPSLEFLPGVWDGTTESAFSKITTDKSSKLDFLDLGKHKIVKNRVRTAATVHILESMGKGYKARLAPPTHRIVIDEVHNDAANTMLRPGDVITHLDGEVIPPEMTVSELNHKIQKLNQSKDFIKIAVNCDMAVAEVLKLRANCSCIQYEHHDF